MASQALYRTWRSQSFETVVGQEHVTLTLRNALRDGRLSHAYLFSGPRGTGKTSTARILAKAINCLDEDPAARPCNHCTICVAISEGRQLDLIEIDAASNRGIDEIRDLREKIGFRPNEARYKVYIIDEVHMLTKEAFNALLKTLEEPPAHAIFVLATTEPDRVPETVRSRCQRFDFRRIGSAPIVEHLEEILAQEGREAEASALEAIARRATGSMRDAISLLDQLLSYGDQVLTVERVENVLGLVDRRAIAKLVGAIGQKDAGAGLSLLHRLVSEGVELGELVDQVLEYLRAVLMVQMIHATDMLDIPEDMLAAVKADSEALTPAQALLAVREFSAARLALRDQVAGVPQLPIELAFLNCTVSVQQSEVGSTVGTAAVERSRAVTPPAKAPASEPEAAHGSAAGAQPGVEAGKPGAAGSVAPAAVPPGGDLLAAAQGSWERLLVAAGKRCGMKVQAALRSVRVLDASGETVMLQFGHAFARDLVNQLDNRSQVEILWSEMLSRRVFVRCTLAGEPVVLAQSAPESDGARATHADDEAFLRGAQELGAVVRKLDSNPQ
jgi:DNA polymerase III subunit gamma/tau